MSVLLQRFASVFVMTTGAFFWQLYKDSDSGVLGEATQLQHALQGHFNRLISVAWPPSTKSAPLLCLIVILFVIFVKDTFFKGGETEESKRVRFVKRRLLLAQMTQALRWSIEDPKDDDKEDEEGEEKKEEEEKKKRPPSAGDLFEMVYDTVEERHATAFGIDADSEPYASTLALFKERIVEDFKDAVRYTALARQEASEAGVVKGVELDGEELKHVAEYIDGTKLEELLKLYNKKVIKAFGRIVDRQLVKEAEIALKELVQEQRKGVHMLLPLLWPLMPLYSVALLLMAFDSMVGCVTYNGLNTLLDGVAAGTMTVEQLKWITAQAYLKLVFCIFAHLSSWAIVGKVTSQFRLQVRNQIMRNMVRQDTKFFDIFPSGILQERLNSDAENLAGKMFHLPNRLLHHFCLTISVSYTLYNLSKSLFYTVLFPIPIISGACYFIIRCMHKLGERQRKIGEHVAANTMEVLKEIKTVREFAMESEEADKFAANSAYRAQIEEYSSALHHIILISPLVCLFDGVRFFFTYMGGYYVAAGTLTVGQAVQAGSLANDLQHIVQGFFHIMPELVTTFQPLGRVCDILNQKPKIEPHPDAPPKLKPDSFRGEIIFKDVDFTYPSEPLKQILFSMSFSISPGEKVGFVGGTGSGKSTAIRLIERFYEPQAGTITLDGLPIQDYDVHHLRRHMSVVAQDNTLFSTTIRENIVYGLPRRMRETITDKEIEDACRKANAWKFVNEFPRKLETYAGERGVKMSGGQKQRLAIARAIIRKPTIVLLDEATSALDSKAELVVKEALDKMISANSNGCTIIIAHRLTTVKECTKIIVMDKGSIKECDPHDKLMKVPVEKDSNGQTLSGWYRDLWETQHGRDPDKDKLELLEAENARLKRELAKVRMDTLKSFRMGHARRVEEPFGPLSDLPLAPISLERARSEQLYPGSENCPPAPPTLTLDRAKTTVAF
mmetsp:Transcript_111598/g.193407  ORF Transcript_111598/g.193407 Transcript_111598/m.193407 type:complete len:953 (-) Transcript_111598:107-2965(-)